MLISFFGEGKTGEPGEKPRGAKDKPCNYTNSTYIRLRRRDLNPVVGDESSPATASSLLDNCPIYQFGVYLEVKYFQASVIIHDICFCLKRGWGA